jgi:hypothetical protein
MQVASPPGYEGLALAESLSYTFSMAQALGMLAHIYQARRQISPTHEWAEKTLVQEARCLLNCRQRRHWRV